MDRMIAISLRKKVNLTTSLSSKGQITVPVFIARRLRLKPGTRISIYPTEDGFRALIHQTAPHPGNGQSARKGGGG